MKKIITLCGMIGLSLVGLTYAAQTLSVSCAGGGSVQVSNVPDSMTSQDLNASYWCSRGGGTWFVSTGDQADNEQEVERIEGSLVLVHQQDAIDYLYIHGLTKFGTANTFMASNELRRDEAAAFYVRLARDVLGLQPDTNKAGCTFSDTNKSYPDLQDEVVAACQLGLFKGSNGKFMPTAKLTNAQALTVLIRLIDGVKSENSAHWADNYFLAAKSFGLTTSLQADLRANLDVAITRGEVAKLIEAGAQYMSLNTK